MSVTLTAYIITEKNIDDIREVHQDIMRSPSYPELKVGNRVVIKTVSEPDPFDPRMGVRHDFAWICTPEEFDSRFEFVTLNFSKTYGRISEK